MAQIIQKTTLNPLIVFSVSESEARALDAMAGYGVDAFIKTFYDKLGAGYMKEHEAGLRQFLKSVRSFIGVELCKIDNAKDALAGKK